jgi:hypothetical protein
MRGNVRTQKSEVPKQPVRRVIAVGKWNGSRWIVRTSIWRYLTSYAMSKS